LKPFISRLPLRFLGIFDDSTPPRPRAGRLATRSQGPRKRVRQLEERTAAGSILPLFSAAVPLGGELGLLFSAQGTLPAIADAPAVSTVINRPNTLAIPPSPLPAVVTATPAPATPSHSGSTLPSTGPLDSGAADQLFAANAGSQDNPFSTSFLSSFQSPNSTGSHPTVGPVGGHGMPGGTSSSGGPTTLASPSPGTYSGPSSGSNGNTSNPPAPGTSPSPGNSQPGMQPGGPSSSPGGSIPGLSPVPPSGGGGGGLRKPPTGGGGGGGGGGGSNPSGPTPQLKTIVPAAGTQAQPANGYLGSTLLQNLYTNYSLAQHNPQLYSQFMALQKQVFMFSHANNQDYVQINVRIMPNATMSSVQTALVNNLGFSVTGTTPVQGLITGFLPILNIPQLVHVSGFAAATPVYTPLLSTGPVTSQGDHVMGADALRAAYLGLNWPTPVNGTGVTVGVVSDSVNQVGTGLAGPESTGALPPSVNVLHDGIPSNTDEGRGMLELVHDTAPGSPLAFSTSDGGPQAMAQGIINLATQANAGVIVDDTLYPNEPFFSPGVITNAINQVTKQNNVVYVSAAGNLGTSSWADSWRAVSNGPGVPGDGGTFMNFASNGTVNGLQQFTLAPGQSLNMTLQWNTPYLEGGTNQVQYAVGTGMWVEIRNPVTMQLIATFNDDNRNTGEALQRVLFTNGTNASVTYGMDFRLAYGPAPTQLAWVRYDSGAPAQYQGGPTIFGHAAAANAITVGAVNYATPTQVEPFSSRGDMMVNLALPNAKNNLAKPDVVGPDGVLNTSFGAPTPGSPFLTFSGTSASAAGVAGVAALFKQEMPGVSATNVAQRLGRTISPTPGAGQIIGGLQQAFKAAVTPASTTSPPLGNNLIIVQQNTNVTPLSGQNQNVAEEAITINPNNPKQLFANANPVDNLLASIPGLVVSVSGDGGLTWTDRIIANGTDGLPLSGGDPTCSWDQFGNLFCGYLSFDGLSVDLLMSTDGGQTFVPVAILREIATGGVDQPTVVTGAGMVWVNFNNNLMTVAGAQVFGPGDVGPFHEQQIPGSVNGNFGDISIGPAGQVMVAWQHDTTTVGPDTIATSVDFGGVTGAFSLPTQAAVTNIGGFDPITPQPNRKIDSEVGLAYDVSNDGTRGRVYMVYTNTTVVGSDNTHIFVQYSDDNGKTWSTPTQIDDDGTENSHFLPKIALDPTSGAVAVSWYDTRFDQGQGDGFFDQDLLPNTDARIFAAVSLDGGLAWSQNVAVGQGSSNAATFGADGGFDFGDYTGLAFYGNNFYPCWADNSTTLINNTSPFFTVATSMCTVPLTTDKFDPHPSSSNPAPMGRLTTFGVGFPGLSFSQSTGLVPPDTNVAVGPTNIVETVNSTIAVYDKTGAMLLSEPLSTFFASIKTPGPPVVPLLDPQVTYDDIANRFIVSALEADMTTGKFSNIDFAISASSDATGGWSFIQRINTQTNGLDTGLFADQPKVGWNADAIVYSMNMFMPSTATPPGPATFQHDQVITISAAALLKGTFVANYFDLPTTGSDGQTIMSLVPAAMHGAAPGGPLGGPLWFVEEDGPLSATHATGTALNVVELVNPLSVLAEHFTFNTIPVNPYIQIPYGNVFEPGGVLNPPLDTRVLNAEWRNGLLVASQNVGISPFQGVFARWYEFNTNNIVGIVQQGTITPGLGASTYMPAISILADGTLGMSYDQSSATQFMSMYITGQRPTDPRNAMLPGVLVQAGQNTYTDFTGLPRLGDYSGISADPSGTSFWAGNEYATFNTTDNWGTFIQNFNPNQTNQGFGTNSFQYLAVPSHNAWNNLPNYDWYTWTATKTSNVTVTLQVLGDVELHVFTVDSTNTLIEVGKDMGLGRGPSRSLTFGVTAGEPIYVEVKGRNSALGYHEPGVYDMTIAYAK
jgi:hypothetical protein